MADALLEQATRQGEHLGGRGQLRTQDDALEKTRENGFPGKAKPPQGGRTQQAPRWMPQADRPAAEAAGEWDFQQLPVLSRFGHVAVRCQPVGVDGRIEKRRAPVQPLPIDEWSE